MVSAEKMALEWSCFGYMVLTVKLWFIINFKIWKIQPSLLIELPHKIAEINNYMGEGVEIRRDN